MAIALASALVALAIALRHTHLVHSPRFGIFHLAVAIAALLGGLRAGLATIGLATTLLLGGYFPWVDGTVVISPADLQSLLFFVATGVVISAAVDLDRLLEDIARRRARIELARAEARTQSVIRSMREGVLVFSTEGRLIFHNPAAEEMLRLTGRDLAEKQAELVEPEVIDADGRRLTLHEMPGWRVLSTGRPHRDMLIGQKWPGEEIRWLKVNAEPVIDPETGALQGAVSTFADHTVRHRFEQELLDSRARLDSIVSRAEDAILAVDESGAIVLFNRAAERMFGLSHDDALGRSLDELLPDWAAAADRTADGDDGSDRPDAGPETGDVGRTILARRNGGGAFAAEASFSRSHDGAGQLLTVILRDATSRRRADETNARLAAIVASSPAAIVAFDRDERISAWNPAAVKMFGYSTASALGAPATMIAFPTDADIVHANIRRILAGDTIIGEAIRRRSDGSPIEVALYATPMRRPDDEVIGASVMFFEIGENRRTERLLRDREDEQRHTLAAAGLGIWWIEEPTGRVNCDPRSAALFGTSMTPDVGEIAGLFAAGAVPPFFAAPPRGGPIDPEPVTARVDRPDGSSTWLSLTARRRITADGIHEIWGTVRDVGAQVVAERAMTQIEASRRLEALGRMTGGIAHDFNNLLTVVSGNLQLMEMLPLDDVARRRVAEALRATESGAALVQRLSTFARQRRLEPAVVDLNTRIAATMDLATRSLGPTVTLTPAFADGLWPVRIDIAEFESALLNLVFNARDAMPNGGAVVIETRNVEVEADALPADGPSAPGPFVRLSVSDNGTGMTAEVRARAFEPFFTTKEVGHGTGLGLSTLHGYVHQSGGFVTLYSEPGHGTTVNVYLPRAEAAPAAEAAAQPAPFRHGRGEVILMVEDHAHVADVTRERLIALGYRVIEASTAPQALAVIGSGEPVDLVFSDVVMPGGMSGLDLARRLRRDRPELRVVLTSGFAEDLVRAGDPVGEPWTVLRKPYSQAELALAVGEALEAPPAGGR